MIHTIQKGKEYKSRLPLSDSISHKKKEPAVYSSKFSKNLEDTAKNKLGYEQGI